MPNQKTWTGKVGDTKTFTISAVPADASDAAAVVAATTATSSDGAIATVTKMKMVVLMERLQQKGQQHSHLLLENSLLQSM